MDLKRHLILGGSGTIGKAFCDYLKSCGQEVINIDLKDGFDLRVQSLEPYKDVDLVWFLAWDVGGSKYLNDKLSKRDIIKNNSQICCRVFSFWKPPGYLLFLLPANWPILITHTVLQKSLVRNGLDC
jgi:hypothetical protein